MWHLKAYRGALQTLSTLKGEKPRCGWGRWGGKCNKKSETTQAAPAQAASTQPQSPIVQAPSPINYSYVETFEAVDKVEEKPANYI